jgi:diacylglycerol O-acyltransferase / wax synthase
MATTVTRRRRRVPAPDARLALADAAWLNMERPTNHFVVTGIMRLEGRVDPERLAAVYEERLAGYERFYQYVAPSRLPLGLPSWRSDPHFEMSRHLRAVDLPARDGALHDYVAAAISRPLDPSRPLWELHIVNEPGRGCVLLSRIHHAIGDGMALLNVLMSLTDEGWAARRRRRRYPRGPVTELTPVLAEVSRLVLDGRHRRESAAFVGRAAQRLARLTLMPFDPPSPFKGRLAEGKRVSWAEPIPLEAARQVGALTGATINDVMLSCATSAMAAYMRSRGVTRLPALRATVPYNLRPLERASGLGNGFTLVYLPLALDFTDPLLRLAETSERMREIKRSPEPLVTNLVLNAIGLLPSRLEDVAVRFFGAKASAVITNVPGPDRELHLDGHPIREIRFWEPESGSIAVGWSVFSYAGRLCVGVIADAGLVPDPGTLITGFEKEFGELAALAARAERRPRRTTHGEQQQEASGAARRPRRGRPDAEQRAPRRAPGRGSRRARGVAGDPVHRGRAREGAAARAPERAPRDQARAVAVAAAAGVEPAQPAT